MTTRSRQILIGVALFLATLALYARTAVFQFVNYDDNVYVFENPHVRAGLTIDSIRSAFSLGYESNWIPLTWISHMVDWRLWGPWAGGHHLVNVFIHAMTAALVFAWLCRATRNASASAFVAAVFAFHPLHVESVAWVSERKDVLCAFFVVLTLIAYQYYTERPNLWRYLLVAYVFALALLAKPMAVTLPFVLLLLDVWPHGRIAARPLRRVGEKIPLLGLTAIDCWLTLKAQRMGGAVQTVMAVPMATRVENAFVACGAYVAKTFVPVRLAVFYPYPPHGYPLAGPLALAAVLLAISVVALFAARRHGYLFTGWFWFLGMLMPVTGLVQVGDQSMADRYMYLPQIGLVIAVTWGIVEAARRYAILAKALRAAAVVIVALLSLMAWRQIGFWRDSITLFDHARAVVADNVTVRSNLGNAYLLAGKYDEAQEQLKRAIELDPTYVRAHANLGFVLSGKKDWANSEAEFRKAIEIDPGPAYLHFGLGVAVEAQGRMDEAAACYTRAIQISPGFDPAYHYLGRILLNQGRSADALKPCRDFVQLNPASADGWINLGLALAGTDKIDDALDSFKKGLAIDPSHVTGQFFYAQALSAKGNTEEARGVLEKLLAQHPDYARARDLLARLQAYAAPR